MNFKRIDYMLLSLAYLYCTLLGICAYQSKYLERWSAENLMWVAISLIGAVAALTLFASMLAMDEEIKSLRNRLKHGSS